MDFRDSFKNLLNPKCNGCKILNKPLPQYAILDYEGQSEVDVLFLSDSPKMFQGEYVAFRVAEYNVIQTEIRKHIDTKKYKIGYTSSVKCPNIKYDDITAKDRKICRSHLDDTIKQYKPKLIFACGKLATTMIYGKNVDEKKGRGVISEMELDGFKFKVMSIIHPFQVVSEPKNAYLFSVDIEKGISEVITLKPKTSKFTFIPIHSVDELNQHANDFIDTDFPISIDIETTGLNFLEDKINTVSLSILDPAIMEPIKTIAFPVDHKEAMHYGLHFKASCIKFLINVCKNKRNRKVGQHVKFDLKFLKRYGVDEVYNIWDCKSMQHLYNEDVPKRLSDLVQYYFPNEI